MRTTIVHVLIIFVTGTTIVHAHIILGTSTTIVYVPIIFATSTTIAISQERQGRPKPHRRHWQKVLPGGASVLGLLLHKRILLGLEGCGEIGGRRGRGIIEIRD